MKDLEVRLPHTLSIEEVRLRIDRALEVARDQYGTTVGPIEASWAGEVLSVQFTAMGMGFTGRAENLPQELLIRVQLPGMASLFAGRIRQGIEERLGGLIAS